MRYFTKGELSGISVDKFETMNERQQQRLQTK